MSQFESKYISINDSIAKTFIELEKTSEKFSLAAINALYLRDKNEGLMDISTLMQFKKEYRLSQVVVANNKGVFVRDTKVDPKTYDLNLFKFCEDYRGMLDKEKTYQITPIILSAPPMIEPIKYTMMSNHNRTRILEVGVHLDFMEEILKGIAETNKDINSISIISPSGNSLGRITKEKGYYLEGEKFNISEFKQNIIYKDNSLFVSSVIPALVDNCCECKMKEITKDATTSEYFYHLLTEVDITPLRKNIASLRYQIISGFLLLLVLVFFLSVFISKKITNKFNSLLEYSKKIAITDGAEKFKLKSSDEVDQIVYSLNRIFDMQLNASENKERAEAYLDKYNTVKQFAHDIKSPLSVFGTILKSKQIAQNEEVNKILEVAIKRINDLSDDILDKVRNSNLETIEISSLKMIVRDIIIEKKFLLESTDKNIDFNLNTSSVDGSIRVNPSILKRIISNVMNNSIEAITKTGIVNISFEATTNRILLKIRDSGSGISKDLIGKVKQEGVTTKTKSTGLGLSHADQYMKSIGGSLNIDTNSLNYTQIELGFPVVSKSTEQGL